MSTIAQAERRAAPSRPDLHSGDRPMNASDEELT